ncbi:MAG: Gfo/Idh/MocA family oxidoreductase [Kiritimatiellae bacterium]|nr:Gfo/Idh/MocA family oxidoreductase [Kiritimatiellia bacterium]
MSGAGCDTPLKALVLGYGIRGRTYAAYAARHPREFELAGLADPAAEFPADSPYPRFRTWEEALAADTGAEAAIIALPDRLHLPAAEAALAKGMHVLLEKPLGCTWDECEKIRAARARAGKMVLAGYVLRYSPYYRELREIVASGEIGELTSVHHLAAISYGKASHAFCRGNWSVESEGTGMLVNKCSHDFDLIEWWTKGRRCRKISSFGSLMHWRPQERPQGAAERCEDCPAQVRAGCPFDARRLYCEREDLRYHFADMSDAAMDKVVKESRYGRCVYAGGNDSVDHQTVLMDFDGGLTIILEMESYSKERRRVSHFFGTRGEIVADEKTIEVKPFLGGDRTVYPDTAGAHGGGDAGIMAQFAFLARKASKERYASILDGALESHRLAFLAEESRKTGKTVDCLAAGGRNG